MAKVKSKRGPDTPKLMTTPLKERFMSNQKARKTKWKKMITQEASNGVIIRVR